MSNVIFPRKRATAVLAAVLVSFGLAACGGGGQSSPEAETGQYDSLDELYDAAVADGQTTITVYGPGEKDFQPIYDAFEAAYPEITVKTEFLYGAELNTKLDQEAITGKPVADLVHLDDAARLAGQDKLAAIEPFTASNVPDDAVTLDGQLNAAAYVPFGFVYNTDNVPEPPEGWEDLLDSQWADRLAIADPTTINGMTNALTAAISEDVLNLDYLENLKSQGPTAYANNAELGSAVATGSSDLGIVFPYTFFRAAKSQGAPVGFVFPVEGGSYVAPYPYGLLKQAPNPLAAELLVNWLYTDDAQQLLPEIGLYPASPDVAPSEGLPPLEDVDRFSLDQAKFAELLDATLPDLASILG